jgi:hypothetical protein
VNRLKKKKLYLTDMTQNMMNAWHRRQRSKTFLLVIPLITLYYVIPSAQMVFTELLRSKESGKTDLF